MSDFRIKAGAASCRLDFPERMFPTDGFKGVHDAPYIGILILDAGKRAALVSDELVNVPEDGVDMQRKIISEKCGVPYENIWVHATHTITTPHAPGGPGLMPKTAGKDHPAPPMPPKGGGRPMDPDAPMKRECFIETLRAATEACAAKAMETFTEAKIGTGTGECLINVNRDIETPFGWWISLGGNEISNKTMTVVKVENAAGAPLAYLVSYGVKPCAIDNSQMKENQRLVCGDVTGFACRMAEKELGAPCLFFTPAAADQVPREQAWYQRIDEEGNVITEDLGVEKGLEIVERLGTEMGSDLIRIAKGTECTLEEGSLEVVSGSFMADARNRGMMPKQPAKEQEFPLEKKQELTGDVIAIGDIAFAAVKPEVCCRTELELWEKSPFEHTLVMSMVNGGMKYMPDKLSYERVTWEGQNTMFHPGTAEKWVDMIVEMLNGIKKGE